MIRVVCAPGRLTAEGHAGYAPEGKDVVCAAASALVWALAGVLQETGRLEGLETGPGRAVVTGKGDCDREFALARCGLEMLAAQYPGCVKVGS